MAWKFANLPPILCCPTNVAGSLGRGNFQPAFQLFGSFLDNSQVDFLLTITDQLKRMYAERLSPRFRERIRVLYYGVAPPERA
ncbi:MAG: hypothetical protein IH927_09825, partial [Proteobacteria bacterium]|nr:hypothetical protein [Pseudomonadota bacterium]